MKEEMKSLRGIDIFRCFPWRWKNGKLGKHLSEAIETGRFRCNLENGIFSPDKSAALYKLHHWPKVQNTAWFGSVRPDSDYNEAYPRSPKESASNGKNN
jgi:hypothetical protein